MIKIAPKAISSIMWIYPPNFVSEMKAKGVLWFATATTVAEAKIAENVFSLEGKVQNAGSLEMPLGTRLKSFIYDIGEGAPGGRRVLTVQTGCIAADMFHIPVDYESFAQIGSIMESGEWWYKMKTTA